MKKVLQFALASVCVLPMSAFANAVTQQLPQTIQAKVQDDKTVLVSPRTGIQYQIENPEQRPVVFQTTEITAAHALNAERIMASNPALSVESQQKAKQALIDFSK